MNTKTPKIVSGIAMTISLIVIAFILLPPFWFWVSFEIAATSFVIIGCAGEWYLHHHPAGRKRREKDEHHKLESRFIGAVVIGVTMELFAVSHSIREGVKLEREVALANERAALAELNLQKLKSAMPDRIIRERNREIILSALTFSNNVARKIPVKILVGETNREADAYARALKNILKDGGYDSGEPDIIRVPWLHLAPPKGAQDPRNPDLFAIFSTETPYPDPGLGGFRVWTKSAYLIAHADAPYGDQPAMTYAYTDDPNAILSSFVGLFEYLGITVQPTSGKGILKPGEIGFFIPKQVE